MYCRNGSVGSAYASSSLTSLRRGRRRRRGSLGPIHERQPDRHAARRAPGGRQAGPGRLVGPRWRPEEGAE
eukprot:654106-Prorocentrum_minimum.AAC.2